MLKALLIEDEGLWQSKLQVMLDELDISIVGCTENVADTIAFLNKVKPDLIIADVLLQNDTVFKVFEHKAQFLQIPTILITVSDKDIHFSQTEKFNRVFYLVKPFHKFTLRSAIEQVCENYATKRIIQPFLPLKGNKNEKINLPISLIHYIEQKGNYCYVFTSKKEFVLKKSLTNIMLELDATFIQVHRSFCINTQYINGFNSSLEKVKLKLGVEIPIGRVHRIKVKEYLVELFLKNTE